MFVGIVQFFFLKNKSSELEYFLKSQKRLFKLLNKVGTMEDHGDFFDIGRYIYILNYDMLWDYEVKEKKNMA